jgi:D-glycero-D-manno-heptose 1,7-bisphosphate phosphatase
MEHELRDAGVTLSASFYCFHHPNADAPSMRACHCRKPSPKMVLDAATEHGIDLRRSWMIGDRDSDIECGQRAGVRTIKVAPDHPQKQSGQQHIIADAEAINLLEAAHSILKQQFSANLKNGISTRSMSSDQNTSKEELA